MANRTTLDAEDGGLDKGDNNDGNGKVGNEDLIKHEVDELYAKIDKLEQRVNEVEKFFMTKSTNQPSTSQRYSLLKDKDKLKHIPGFKRYQQEASRREAAAAKRMQELMRQFGSILRQITQHKWAWPFMQPVDVEGLGLYDYYEVIDRPMDFSTIKNQMEAKDGTGYKHVRDICADMRLVFRNAMKYNDDKSEVYNMAKTLSEKFEEKWLQLLPKVIEEEKRREDDEAEAQTSLQHAQEAAHSKMARDLSNELYDANMHLEELREIVAQKCRKMSIEDKRNLGIALTQLSTEDLSKALDIVAQYNPSFQATATEVDLDIDAQSESTLWRLKFYVRDALENQRQNPSTGTDKVANEHDAAARPSAKCSTTTSKQKKETSDALEKSAKKKNKKF